MNETHHTGQFYIGARPVTVELYWSPYVNLLYGDPSPRTKLHVPVIVFIFEKEKEGARRRHPLIHKSNIDRARPSYIRHIEGVTEKLFSIDKNLTYTTSKDK